MMNKIYDFEQIDKIRAEQKKLIFHFVLYAVGFIVLTIFACLLIKSNILLTLIFALALLAFVLYSIVFWKVKYGILREYKTFLDNLETGRREDNVGVFEGLGESRPNDEDFIKYIFVSSNTKKCLLTDDFHKIDFVKGKKYHLECVGEYIVQWKMIE